MVEGKWRLAVDEVLGKKCVFNNNIWLLTAVWGQMGHFEQALGSLHQTKGPPPPAGLPTMLERQPKRTASVLIGQCGGKEANRQSHLQAIGNLGKPPEGMVAIGMALVSVLVMSSFGRGRERAASLFFQSPRSFLPDMMLRGSQTLTLFRSGLPRTPGGGQVPRSLRLDGQGHKHRFPLRDQRHRSV